MTQNAKPKVLLCNLGVSVRPARSVDCCKSLLKAPTALHRQWPLIVLDVSSGSLLTPLCDVRFHVRCRSSHVRLPTAALAAARRLAAISSAHRLCEASDQIRSWTRFFPIWQISSMQVLCTHVVGPSSMNSDPKSPTNSRYPCASGWTTTDTPKKNSLVRQSRVSGPQRLMFKPLAVRSVRFGEYTLLYASDRQCVSHTCVRTGAP